MEFEPAGVEEFEGICAWSSRGEFLGAVTGASTVPEAGGAVSGPASGGEAHSEYLQVGRGGPGGGISVALHRFTRAGGGGYRVRIREWDDAGERAYWVAPATEDEGYIGTFTEEEARRAFPYLFAAEEMPGGFEIG